MKRSSEQRETGGFSIIELLIAIIIIGILVAVIVPVLLNRAEEARKAAAETDIEHIREAETRAFIDTGYLYRFYILDDVIGGDNRFNASDKSDVDGVRDERINTSVVDPTRLFINRKTGLFVQAGTGTTYNDLYLRLVNNETQFGWDGPYINIHTLRDADFDDCPEDPWGNEYLMFTQAGLVNQYLGIIETVYYFNAIDVPTSVGLKGPYFDRPTILSLGPNGAPGDGMSGSARFGADDDIMQQF
jgi:prepilin-type N-terminal cleavage/methylation domain-containing protein